MSISPINLFYSYAEEDELFRKDLEKHLKLLERQGRLAPWHFRMITGGKEYKGEIDQHINESKIILLLISADFLSSDYCYDIEMKKAMNLHEIGAARVIPVILRPCDWQSAPFGKLQALPKDATPISKWADRDDAFLNVQKGIKKVIQELNPEIISKPKLPHTETSTQIPHGFEVTNTYCARCGIKAGTRSECTNLTGEHSFKSYSGDVYCARCGIKAGTRSECTNLTGEHSFKSSLTNKSAITAYCTTCHKKREINNPKKIKTVTGRSGVTGTCPVCRTKLLRLFPR